MKFSHIIVIGGSAAGVTAAMTARKFYQDKSIIMIKNVVNVPIPCGIPYIFGTIDSVDKNALPTNKMMTANHIDVLECEVASIDPKRKVLTTTSGQDLGYEKLILANGSLPIIPPIKGKDLKHVYPIVKNLDHLRKMLEEIKPLKSFVIIGGGFIGVEMAEEIKKMNPEAHVTIVEMQDHCLQLVYDEDLSALAEQALLDQGIKLETKETVVEFVGHGDVEGVVLKSGRTIKADCVILGIGATPNTKLAKEAGLKLGPARGIEVDRYMQTSEEDIFACGDVADKISFFDGKPSSLRLASIATTEGRIAGFNTYKLQREFKGAIGVFSTYIGHKVFAAAGLTVRDAIAKGYQIVSADSEAVNRHPGCMPNAENLKVRLVFDKQTQILIGGQVYGAVTGGEFINVIAALIASKAKAEDIVLFQAGTHPALTASPVAYQLVTAAESALIQFNQL
jgi:NADPH-dependent 2,4-dienoyl-CoA reductase/sulfur reductase-like enzyme